MDVHRECPGQRTSHPWHWSRAPLCYQPLPGAYAMGQLPMTIRAGVGEITARPATKL